MVYIYMAKTWNLPDPKENPKVLEGLSEERREKILRKNHLEGRKEALGAGLLLKEVLVRFGHTQEEIRINENGKPEIEGFHFNLSHSHEMAVCVVGEDEVGCDVEKVGAFRENVEKRICSERERVYLEGFSGDERTREFYKVWTRKESYVKMTGEGIRFPLCQVEFLQGEIYRKGQPLPWNLREYEWGEYVLSICAKEKEFASPKIVRISERF